MIAGGRGDRLPVISYRSGGPARAPPSGYGIASCVLAAFTLLTMGVEYAAVTGTLRTHVILKLVLVFPAVGNLVGVCLGIAGVTADGRNPTLGGAGLVANIAGLFAGACCCAVPLDWD
jgi:hypothetical protein